MWCVPARTRSGQRDGSRLPVVAGRRVGQEASVIVTLVAPEVAVTVCVVAS